MTERNIDRTKSSQVTIGNGNIFADLGLPNAEEMLVKAQLSKQIHIQLSNRHLELDEAAKILYQFIWWR